MPFQNRLYSLSITVIFLAYAIGRVVSSFPAINNPRVLADTTAYLRISRQPIYEFKFWSSARPPVFPLLLKIAKQDDNIAAMLHLGFSIFAWSFLALMTIRFLEFTWLKLFAFCLVLSVSLDRHVAGWDFVMMTESLSISLLVLFIALFTWLLQEWHIGKIVLLFIIAFLLAFTRDTNAWILLALAGLILLTTILRWTDYRMLILAVSFAFVFFISNTSATLGGRWVFPLGNLIGQRVLTNGSAIEFFRSCGMPVTPALLRLSGKFSNADDRAMYDDPELETFRNWLRSEERRVG